MPFERFLLELYSFFVLFEVTKNPAACIDIDIVDSVVVDY